MKKTVMIIGLIFYGSFLFAQGIDGKLAAAMQVFEKDSQMRHAIVGLAVLDAKTGKMIYGKNEQVGLAPASTQKIFTSAAALELLGKDYRYKTELAYDGKIVNGILNGNIYIIGSGDPTLGSWRYSTTKDSVLTKHWADAVIGKISKGVKGFLYVNESKFPAQVTPGGWIWDDIGNYYGAGARQLNWHENQYDLVLKPGKNIGDSVKILSAGRMLNKDFYINDLKTAAAGSGDNAYIYFSLDFSNKFLLSGTIPAGVDSFTISGAQPDPGVDCASALIYQLALHNDHRIHVAGGSRNTGPLPQTLTNIYTHYSPTLDSIVYWFMRRSINLYGEALVKTIGYEKSQDASTENGVRIVRDFWAANGIDRSAVNMIDGSGLSPQNRVTADALAQVLFFAQSRPWYAAFYESLPSYNGMKLKSGSIGGARAFAGYHTSAEGKSYIVAIIVNNYSGSPGEIVKKMYRVLDTLK